MTDRILVALDVDGVIYRWGRAARDLLYVRFGRRVPEDVWMGADQVTEEEWEWLWSEPILPLLFGGGPPFPGAVEAAQRLAEISDVRILTACPEVARDARIRWLDDHNIPYKEVRFVDPPGNSGIPAAAKHEVLPHCDVYIDDNPNNCNELVEHTDGVVLLVDHSWNQPLEPGDHTWPFENTDPRVARVKPWQDVIEVVEEVASARDTRERTRSHAFPSTD